MCDHQRLKRERGLVRLWDTFDQTLIDEVTFGSLPAGAEASKFDIIKLVFPYRLTYIQEKSALY